MDTAHRLDRLIDRLELSNQDVADAVRVSDQTIARWRRGVGKGPSLAQGVALARKLNTTVEYLATGRLPEAGDLTETESAAVDMVRALNLSKHDVIRRLSRPTADPLPPGREVPGIITDSPRPEPKRPRKQGKRSG